MAVAPDRAAGFRARCPPKPNRHGTEPAGTEPVCAESPFGYSEPESPAPPADSAGKADCAGYTGAAAYGALVRIDRLVRIGRLGSIPRLVRLAGFLLPACVNTVGRPVGQPRLWPYAVIHPVLLQKVASHEVIPRWRLRPPRILTVIRDNTYKTPQTSATLQAVGCKLLSIVLRFFIPGTFCHSPVTLSCLFLASVLGCAVSWIVIPRNGVRQAASPDPLIFAPSSSESPAAPAPSLSAPSPSGLPLAASSDSALRAIATRLCPAGQVHQPHAHGLPA